MRARCSDSSSSSAGGILGYWALSQQLEERSITELLGKRDLMTHVLSELPSVESVAASRHRFGDLLIGHDHVHLALVDPRNGQVLSSFSSIASESIRVLDASPMEAPVAWQPSGGLRLMAVRGQAPVGDRLPVRFYLSLDTGHDRRLLSGFVRASLVGLPILSRWSHWEPG